MQTLKSITQKQQAASPTYFDDPEKARLMKCMLSLAEEICVLRDRLDTCSKLADQDKPATDANIESFEVTDEMEAQRLQRHTELFECTLAAVKAGPNS
jgi:hypothetical protein